MRQLRAPHYIFVDPAVVNDDFRLALDERFESNGVALYVDPLSYQYLDQTEIDYVESPHGYGFKFANPNVSSTCGCGSSFKV